MSSQHVCEVCEKKGQFSCGSCRKIFYCSKKHQMENWQTHKSACRAYKICDGLKASRILKPGDFIFEEKPLIWGPAFNSLPVCLGCGKNITRDRYRECLKCGFPVCSEICEKSPEHLPECRYTSQRGERVKIEDPERPNPVYNFIITLRCLYQKQFLPKKWKRLEKFISNQTVAPSVISTAEAIRRFFKLWHFSAEEIARLHELAAFNSFQILAADASSCVALYANSSFLEHNCRPNCRFHFTRSGRIVLKAATDISEGDSLSVSFVDPLLPTPTRRRLIHDLKSFWCFCSRCRDTTEFRTNFSALKCREDNCRGSLLPKTFTDLQEIPDWTCNKCGSFISSYSAYDLLERIQKDFQDLDKSHLESCLEFWDTYKDFLHENHFYFFRIKFLLNEILNDFGGMSDDDLKLKMFCCESLENLVRVLAPGEWKILGKILYEKFEAVREFSKRQFGENRSDNLKEILLEVVDILGDSPDDDVMTKTRKSLEELELTANS